MYDSIIIGTGPAGLSVALNLKIHQKDFLWIGTKRLSEKVIQAEQVLNYPGFSGVTGKELFEAFEKQIEDMELEITEGMVTQIMPMGDHYAVMAGNDFYETRTIVLTTGLAAAATLPGEADYIGKGVSYCATCDGMLYRGKTIGVICNAARFEHEVSYLAEIAEKVYLYAGYQGCSIDLPNVEKISVVKELHGEQRVSGMVLRSGEEIAVDGVFCLRNSIAMSTLLPGLELEDHHLKVNRRMETSLAGCFAAGDCTGRPYQYTKSVGEGNVAAHSLIEYLGRQ